MTTAPTERAGYAHTVSLRNADYDDIKALLEKQAVRKLDLVVPAEQLRFTDGMLRIEGVEPEPNEDGVTDPNGTYWPTATFDSHVAERLGIPVPYLRRLRNGKAEGGKLITHRRLDMWDENVNGLLQGNDTVAHDQRNFMARLLMPEDGIGVATGLMSDKYGEIDHLDVLTAVMDGIREAGVDKSTLRITGDLSETRMYMHVHAPEILAAAPTLFEGYHSPLDGGPGSARRVGSGLSLEQRVELGRRWREGTLTQELGEHHMFTPGSEPLVYAGFLVRNSENGYSKASVIPEIVGLGCTNGMLINADAFGAAHRGDTQEEGWTRWSEDTRRAIVRVIKNKVKDLVVLGLTTDYLNKVVDRLSEKAGKPVEDAKRTIQVVGKQLRWTEGEQEGILNHFMRASKWTTGGIMHAVTSFSQTVADADAAHELNLRAVEAMEKAYALN